MIIVEILKVLSWQHTVPLAAVIVFIAAFLIFRDSFGRKIPELKSVKGSISKFEMLFELADEKPKNTIPNPGDTVITTEDVISAFGKIPDLKNMDIRGQVKHLHFLLLQRGIIARQQLDALTSPGPVLDKLRELYITELKRPKDAPLDPVAVATWGAYLYAYDLRPDIVEAIRVQLTQSTEAGQKRDSSA
ncbi:MAG: hypothetical protein HY326_00805 [Chloroflexi bacterium]|nr:hypothetical protein [Chloroflexota bacterium]